VSLTLLGVLVVEEPVSGSIPIAKRRRSTTTTTTSTTVTTVIDLDSPAVLEQPLATDTTTSKPQRTGVDETNYLDVDDFEETPIPQSLNRKSSGSQRRTRSQSSSSSSNHGNDDNNADGTNKHIFQIEVELETDDDDDNDNDNDNEYNDNDNDDDDDIDNTPQISDDQEEVDLDDTQEPGLFSRNAPVLYDYHQDLELKPDHEHRPIWLCGKDRAFLETFSPVYQQAYDFLITIAEPICRYGAPHSSKCNSASH
jgi:hypothetical protein